MAPKTAARPATPKPAGPLPEYPWPQNLDAERAVLGAILENPRRFREARIHCEPADFFLDVHRELFQAMESLERVGTPIDILTVHAAVDKSPSVTAAGGLAYISGLAVGETKATPITTYAKMVADRARDRNGMNCAAKLYADFSAGDQPTTEIVANAVKLYSGLAASNGACDFLGLFDAPNEMQDSQPTTFAIRDFLQTDAATLIAGLVGSYKTFAALSISKALLDSTITHLWDMFPVVHKSERVIYLIPESARGPFKTRLEMMGLMPYIHSRKLLVRTLNKGPVLQLQDPRFLAGVAGADIVLDTGIRFMSGAENEAGDAARGLSTDILAMIAARARSVIVLLHSPKSFESANYMNLENMVRGSSELGAPFATGWGIRQLPGDIAHIENLKARDFNACGPFQLLARPSISETGDFQMHRHPGTCGTLSEELPSRNNSGASADAQENRAIKKAMLRTMLAKDPHLTSAEITTLFAQDGIEIAPGTIRRYRAELNK